MRAGGYEQLKQALTIPRAEIVNKVKNSGLRGRGGAGFSCGLKWRFIKPDEKRPVYLICNADESEPGTFKDRYIIHEDPHQLLEGMLISCYALNAHTAYIYIRGEFPEGATILERAIEEARQHNFLGKNILGSGFDVEFYIHRGAGAYICGEETGLIESLEGKRGYPRIKPPYFPAVLGLYMCPTIVNNVETLCNIKHIVAIGGAEYARLGRPNNTGTRVLCVSGDVQRPGYFEIEVGALTMGQLIYQMAGGLRPGRKLKAVIPGGSSAKVLRADERFKLKERQADGSTIEREISIDDIPMDFDSLAAAGSMAGSGGVIVLDDSRDMVWALNNINKFYAHESCGQCTPCREGSLWMKNITERIISAAIRVHRELGPEFLEAMYEEALAIELTAAGLSFDRQKLLPVCSREHLSGEHRLDFLVEGKGIVELKAISALEDIHFAIVRSYLKAANLQDALVLNFTSLRLIVKRVGREYHPMTKGEDLVL